jgi:uncharacterized surface protein with fasciclin (FAS1) repeats
MKKLVIPIVAVLIITVGIFAVSCTSDDDLQNLLEIAQSTAGLESLVNVVLFVDANATDDPELAAALADESLTITVFAPNNEAFVAVFGDNDGDGIVEEEDIQDFADAAFSGDLTATADALLDVVSYHLVLGTAYDSTAVVGLIDDPTGIDTVAEVALLVTQPDTDIILDPEDGTSEAALTSTLDVEASNGIAHVIAAVLGLVVAE